jgi:hypothetical protein
MRMPTAKQGGLSSSRRRASPRAALLHSALENAVSSQASENGKTQVAQQSVLGAPVWIVFPETHFRNAHGRTTLYRVV